MSMGRECRVRVCQKAQAKDHNGSITRRFGGRSAATPAICGLSPAGRRGSMPCLPAPGIGYRPEMGDGDSGLEAIIFEGSGWYPQKLPSNTRLSCSK